MVERDHRAGHPRRERILGLDVLRGLAILLVMVAHYTNNISFWYGLTPPPAVFFTGDLGVDLFFALSGFLIGGILIDVLDRAPSWSSLWRFMLRRWLRTLPAYWTWLAVLALAFPPVRPISAPLPRFATMTQNLLQPMPPDYWFAVSWSLPVEEWFYLLFGAGAIGAAVIWRARPTIWLPLVLLLVVPLGLRLGIPGFVDWTTGLYKVVPFRLDEIGYGVAMAWLVARRSPLSARPWPLLLLGAGLIAAGWFALLPLPFRIFVIAQHAMTALGCTLCIPAALRLRVAPRWLAFLAAHASRLAYSLYLVHLTILVDVAQAFLGRHEVSRAVAVAIGVFGAWLAAETLNRLVERPFMRARPPQYPSETLASTSRAEVSRRRIA